MPEDDRLQAIKHLLFNYARSRSLRHIRDPHAVIVLANEIMRVVDSLSSNSRAVLQPNFRLYDRAAAIHGSEFHLGFARPPP
jgi:hypothetical protein